MFATLACAALLSGVSCVADEESVTILGVPQLQPDEEREGALGCKARAGGDEFMQGLKLDLSFKQTGFTYPVELQNNIQLNPADSNNAGIEHSEVRLRSADVSIRTPQVPAIEDAIRALGPEFLDFNIPLTSVSVAGGGTRRVIFVQVSPQIIDKLRDAMVGAGFGDGTEIIVVFETRIHFDLSGGFGKVGSRKFTLPVATAMGNLRVCVPTAWTDGEGTLFELCTPENCANTNLPPTAVCGNAQMAAQSPACCDGPEKWADIPNAGEICGVQ